MRMKGILLLLFIMSFSIDSTILSKETGRVLKPAPGKKEEPKKSIRPSTAETKKIKYEELSKVIKESTERYLLQYKDILKEEIKPKTEFETEEEYRKRVEGASAELNKKKIQLMGEIYRKKVYYRINENPVELPQYNAEEKYFDIKLATLPLLENVIYQPPEEETNLRFVPTEAGGDLMLRLKIPPNEGKRLRENDKNIRENLSFTIYVSLKNQEDLNIYSVVAFSEVELYVKNKDSVSSIYKQSLRINTPTFPKRD